MSIKFHFAFSKKPHISYSYFITYAASLAFRSLAMQEAERTITGSAIWATTLVVDFAPRILAPGKIVLVRKKENAEIRSFDVFAGIKRVRSQAEQIMHISCYLFFFGACGTWEFFRAAARGQHFIYYSHYFATPTRSPQLSTRNHNRLAFNEQKHNSLVLFKFQNRIYLLPETTFFVIFNQQIN